MPTAYAVSPPKLLAAAWRIRELEDELRRQLEFLKRIERADTGWWDKDEMENQQAAIWNLLEPTQ